MNDRLKKIFEIMSFYDNFRWSNENNYNSINFFRDDLDDDTKILTHWLCYIMDRQISYKIVWDVGGFIISELIYNIKEYNTLTLLNPNSSEAFVKPELKERKYFLLSHSNANEKIIKNYKNYITNKKVRFKSRFFPADYFAILYTFVFLENYDFYFSKFVKEVYLRNKSENDFIKRMLFSFYLVTYYDIKQPSSNLLSDFERNINKAKERRDEILQILNNANRFEKEYKKFIKGKIFEQKRAWCSLRDFLKSPEFKNYFKNALKKEKLPEKDLSNLFSYQSLTQLELPGDIWNNNSKFRECILKGTEYEDSKEPLNKILRDFFDKNGASITGYPEQFDVTFDFVQRMCELDNCDICPIDKINNKKNNLNKICINDESMYCPIALVSCNYKNDCIGINKCNLA